MRILIFHIQSQRNDFMIKIMTILISYLIVHHCLTLHNGSWIHAILITGHNYDKLEINMFSYQNQRYLTKCVIMYTHVSVFVYVWKICMWMSKDFCHDKTHTKPNNSFIRLIKKTSIFIEFCFLLRMGITRGIMVPEGTYS